VNLGTNGTYLEDAPIEEIPACDGSIVRLARTGPQIQLHVSHPPPVSPAQQLLKHLQERGTPDEDTTSDDPPPKTRVVRESSPEVSSD
jgi:hypothetical protein